MAKGFSLIMEALFGNFCLGHNKQNTSLAFAIPLKMLLNIHTFTHFGVLALCGYWLCAWCMCICVFVD